MKFLFVLYDTQCPFCMRVRQWLGEQRAIIPLEFIPFQSPELVAQFEGLDACRTNGGMLVISDEGGVYQGAQAFIMCLFALRNYRDWSRRLSTPALLPLTMKAVDLLASNRKDISRWLASLGDDQLVEFLHYLPAPECEAIATVSS